MYDVFIMDMAGHDANVQSLQTLLPHACVVRYYDNHLDTLKRCISRARTPYAWVIASCCDYSGFDFDYRAVPWESHQLHCWHSGYEKFGDTFLINVDEFKAQWDIALLEWYKEVNWHYPGVPRLPWPLLETSSEDITEELKNCKFDAPYICINQRVDFHAPLWRDRVFYSFNACGSVALAPREIQTHLTTQIYNYPYIMKQKLDYLIEKPLDIIYLSYNESVAEKNYEHLVQIAGRPVKRVNNVIGRVDAYQTAAKLSETPWFFLVPAKLEVNERFNWEWQPDYLQEPKHYIFNAQNPITGLEYGHMAMIAYNKTLALATDDSALDFALSKSHTVIPLLSGIARYDSDPLIVWRTAFRETLKLKEDIDKTGNIESEFRLDMWTTQGKGPYGIWSTRGAQDALAYYQSVDGDYMELMRSYDWAWLKNYYESIYAKV